MTTLLSGVRYLASQMLYFTSMAEFWVTGKYRITILCFTSKSIHHHGEKKRPKETKDKLLSSHYSPAPPSNRDFSRVIFKLTVSEAHYRMPMDSTHLPRMTCTDETRSSWRSPLKIDPLLQHPLPCSSNTDTQDQHCVPKHRYHIKSGSFFQTDYTDEAIVFKTSFS